MKNFISLNKKGIIVLAAVVAAGVLVWAATHFTKTPAFSSIQFVEAKKGTIKSELSKEVTFEPSVDIQLAFENTGKISNVLVDVGDKVKKGQLLAEQKNSDYVFDLNEKIANMKSLESLVEAARKNVSVQKAKLHSLKKSNAAKYDVKAQEEIIDQAKAQEDSENSLLDAAKEAVKRANLNLAKTRLLAPMNGVITEKSIETGKVVSQASPVMTMATEDNLEAIGYVSELDVKKLAVGNAAEISVSSAVESNIVVQASIKNIYPAGTIQNGASSFKIVFELSEQNSVLKSGMTGTAKIKLSDQMNAIYIPQSSLFSDEGEEYVMVMSGGFPERKKVQVGAYGSDGTVQILSGIAEGDKIISF